MLTLAEVGVSVSGCHLGLETIQQNTILGMINIPYYEYNITLMHYQNITNTTHNTIGKEIRFHSREISLLTNKSIDNQMINNFLFKSQPEGFQFR